MKLSQLRDVLAVAEHGSLRAAGRHLDVAQPAITRSIQELEKELGVALFERFAELTGGKMALFVSHRFSTVRMADRIVVLAGGQLVEEGDHARLMAKGGQYAEMFEMQAASYR